MNVKNGTGKEDNYKAANQTTRVCPGRSSAVSTGTLAIAQGVFTLCNVMS